MIQVPYFSNILLHLWYNMLTHSYVQQHKQHIVNTLQLPIPIYKRLTFHQITNMHILTVMEIHLVCLSPILNKAS